jgi:hypothetical protein
MRPVVRLVLLSAIVAGCSLQNVKLYDGPDRPASEQVTVSAIGLYPDRQLSLMVVEIDGKSIASGRAASFLLLPGTYQVKVQATKDFKAGGSVVTYKRAEPVSRLEARAGHTYVPNARLAGDVVSIYFDDKGPDFPPECLPLYVEVNRSVNPGHALYRTAKTCAR